MAGPLREILADRSRSVYIRLSHLQAEIAGFGKVAVNSGQWLVACTDVAWAERQQAATLQGSSAWQGNAEVQGCRLLQWSWLSKCSTTDTTEARSDKAAMVLLQQMVQSASLSCASPPGLLEAICRPPDKQVPSCIYLRLLVSRLLGLSRLLAFVHASWQRDQACSPAVLCCLLGIGQLQNHSCARMLSSEHIMVRSWTQAAEPLTVAPGSCRASIVT